MGWSVFSITTIFQLLRDLFQCLSQIPIFFIGHLPLTIWR